MFCRCSELEHLQNTKHAHMQNLSLNPSNVHRTLENITMTKHNNDYLHQFILIPRIQTCILIININGGEALRFIDLHICEHGLKIVLAFSKTPLDKDFMWFHIKFDPLTGQIKKNKQNRTKQNKKRKETLFFKFNVSVLLKKKKKKKKLLCAYLICSSMCTPIYLSVLPSTHLIDITLMLIAAKHFKFKIVTVFYKIGTFCQIFSTLNCSKKFAGKPLHV